MRKENEMKSQTTARAGRQEQRAVGVADDPIRRQHALRQWHTRPDAYPLDFRVHLERGDFDRDPEVTA